MVPGRHDDTPRVLKQKRKVRRKVTNTEQNRSKVSWYPAPQIAVVWSCVISLIGGLA